MFVSLWFHSYLGFYFFLKPHHLSPFYIFMILIRQMCKLVILIWLPLTEVILYNLSQHYLATIISAGTQFLFWKLKNSKNWTFFFSPWILVVHQKSPDSIYALNLFSLSSTRPYRIEFFIQDDLGSKHIMQLCLSGPTNQLCFCFAWILCVFLWMIFWLW